MKSAEIIWTTVGKSSSHPVHEFHWMFGSTSCLPKSSDSAHRVVLPIA